MSLVLEARPISRSSPSRCWKIRYDSRIDTAEIMPSRCRSSITAGQRQVQHSGTPQGSAVRLMWRSHYRRGRAGLLAGVTLEAVAVGLVPDSCQIQRRTTATDGGRRVRSNSHRPRSAAVSRGRRARWVPVEE
jgi:hypothetical protein